MRRGLILRTLSSDKKYFANDLRPLLKHRSFLVKIESSRVKIGISSDCFNFLTIFRSLRSSKSQKNGRWICEVIENLKCDTFSYRHNVLTICKFRFEAFSFPYMSFVWPTMLHIKKLIGMHNKRTYTRVFTYAYRHTRIRV